MTASGIASRIIGFFYRIFLAQTIGAEALGVYQLIAPVFAMCFALTASSIQTSISKFVGDACGKNAGTSQGEITARGYLLLGLVISCTASVIVGIFLYTQADWIALHFLGELRCAPLLSLLSFSMLPCCIHACINGYYYGKKRAGIPSFCQLVEQLARVGSVWLIYQYTLEKGMELTAFHAVAGLVAGECSGLITSLIAMSLEKRLPGHSYHTLSGQWKTMGKLFSSMAVPLTINRVTTALFNSLENLLIPQKLQAFGYSASDALSIFGILTGMTMSIILFPSVLTNSFSVLLLPAVSEAHSAHNHAQIARAIKKAILYGLLLGFVFTILFLIFGDRMGEVLFHNTLAGNFICQLSWLCPLLYVTSLLNSILHGLGNARAGFVCHTAGMHDQDLHDSVSRPTVRNRCISVGDAAVLCICCDCRHSFAYALFPCRMIPHFLISLRQKKRRFPQITLPEPAFLYQDLSIIRCDYTRDRYSPVLVSILILSPCSTNRGTFTFAPVSTVAGLVAPVAVSPLNPGSVSVISSSTKRGGSTANTLPL